jgi:hypothetical protein
MGPHKNEKLKEHTLISGIHPKLTYLLILKRLPIVNNAANFLDFTTITGVKASACIYSSLHLQRATDKIPTYQTKAY